LAKPLSESKVGEVKSAAISTRLRNGLAAL
jgi:hypothetical protein